MLTSPFAAGLAKTAAVGVLMAAGAAGIYVVANTRSTDDGHDVVGAAPTATATLQLAQATPQTSESPSETAIPGLPSDAMFIGVSVWVQAQPVIGANIAAIIAGTECADARSGGFGDSGVAGAYFSVPAASVKRGCGTPGAVVEFAVDGVIAPQSVAWQPGSHPPVDLMIGGEFARYYGKFSYGSDLASYVVDALIDGAVCASSTGPERTIPGLTTWDYLILVPSVDLRAGCAQPDSNVTFRLTVMNEDGSSEEAVVLVTVPWQPGPIVHLPGVQTPESAPTP